MGGFLGIGESDESKAIKAQGALKEQELAKSRKDAEIALAERKANKGQATANIKLGTSDEIPEEKKKSVVKTKAIGPSSSLGIGGLGNKGTGIQL